MAVMKKICALLFCVALCGSLVACGGGNGAASDAGTGSAGTGASDVSVSSGNAAVPETEDSVPNMVMACDQKNERIVVYDLDQISPGDSLDDAEVWSVDAGYAADMKYREDTVFGDVVIVAGSTSGIYSYPEGKAILTTNNPGNNPHAIEILPGGNVVIANSTGGTLRFFPASAALEGDLEGAAKYHEYQLKGAHGVVWDPESEVLWALGDDELVAYMLKGEGPSQTMMKVGGMGGALPEDYPGGHDLSADYTDAQYLYMTTNKGSLKFNKANNTFLSNFNQSSKLSRSGYMKALSNNPNGNFFYVYSNFGKGTSWENEKFADWCSDRITYCYWTSEKHLEVQEYVSQTCAFYKCRAFCGQYQ